MQLGMHARKMRLVLLGIQALLEEVETGQEKLTKAQKHADICQAKVHALQDQ